MKQDLIARQVRLDAHSVSRIKSLSARTGFTENAIIRKAIEVGIGRVDAVLAELVPEPEVQHVHPEIPPCNE
jgi:predicted DNA-binding protein